MTEHNRMLVDKFKEFFSIDLITTREQLDNMCQVRYRVYCEEFGYEEKDKHANGRESDAFDDFAVGCLITHLLTGRPAGCVRVIPSHHEGKRLTLPYENFARDCLHSDFIESLKLDPVKVCEVSRLAVDGAFRRRSGEAVTRFGEIDALDVSQQEKRTFSLISISAFLAAIAMSDLFHVPEMFAMMEPFLPRMLSRSGIYFERVGDDIDYHGLRAPYYASTPQILQTMVPDLKGFYGYIHERLNDQKAKLTK